MKVLKVAILGSGAIGTLFGTSLVKAGHDILFLDGWSKLIDAISKDPKARLHHSNGKIEESAIKFSSYENAPKSEFDLIWITVKSSETDKVIGF
jgi:2-dehydropantoate 2-reductase